MPPRKRSTWQSSTKLSATKLPDDLADFVDCNADADLDIMEREPHRSPRKMRLKTRHQGRASGITMPKRLFDEESMDSDDMADIASFFTRAKAVPLMPRSQAWSEALPEVDASSRDRLMALLADAGLQERKVCGDGNCQFRALADQLYGDEEHHHMFRAQAVQQMESCTEAYCGFVQGSFDRYLARMRRDGTWGDHVTLQAAADALGLEVHLLSDYMTDAYIQVIPKAHKSKKILKLCFWAEYHYNSVQ